MKLLKQLANSKSVLVRYKDRFVVAAYYDTKSKMYDTALYWDARGDRNQRFEDAELMQLVNTQDAPRSHHEGEALAYGFYCADYCGKESFR